MLASVDSTYLVLAAIVLLVALVVFWMWGRSRPRRPSREYTDVLSEGAAPAARNAALIEAPSAAALAGQPPIVPAPAAVAMAGLGEVVAAAAQEEVAAAVAQPPATPNAPVDDLARIKGVGPKLKALLGSLGVTSFAQIAAWTDDDIARVDAQLGNFAGRPVRDNWVEQARLLASGDTAAYEARFGKV